MRNLIIILVMVLLPGCKLWHWGETFYYQIPEGKHSDLQMPALIKGTAVWGGEIILSYDPLKMIDTIYNFSYWNKLGGMMPNLDSNFIPGKHQSARVAWRIDPPEYDHIYLGYIVYTYGNVESHRGYLRTANGEKIKVPVGATFYAFVSKYKEWWGVTAYYGSKEYYMKIEDPLLKKEKFLVVMDPYYGGEAVAPTQIDISIRIKDTAFLYNIAQ